jgi:hypothetical protein
LARRFDDRVAADLALDAHNGVATNLTRGRDRKVAADLTFRLG